MIDNVVFKDNDTLLKKLNYSKFLSTTIRPTEASPKITEDRGKDLEACLNSLPFGVLNLTGLDVNAVVQIIDGRPRFPPLNPSVSEGLLGVRDKQMIEKDSLESSNKRPKPDDFISKKSFQFSSHRKSEMRVGPLPSSQTKGQSQWQSNEKNSSIKYRPTSLPFSTVNPERCRSSSDHSNKNNQSNK